MALVLLQIINSCFKKPASSSTTNVIVPSYRRQRFSLPEPILHYISKNPSNPKTYQKLIKTCKYFFIKNPILILHCLQYENKEWKICDNFRGENCCSKNLKKFDIENISKTKIWILHRLVIHPSTIESAPGLAEWFFKEKLFRHETTVSSNVRLYRQEISINDLIPRYSQFRHVSLQNVVVKCENGNDATMDTILKQLPNVKSFSFYNKSVPNSTNLVENLIKISHFSNLTCFGFNLVSEGFNFEALYSYMKTNKRMAVILRFDDTISAESRDRLKEIVEEVLQISPESKDYLPLYLRYPGQDGIVMRKMNKNLLTAIKSK